MRPDLDLQAKWSGYDTALKLIVAEKPVHAPGTAYLYSDINFAILGALVQRLSGLPLDVYCARHIFRPLDMHDTSFKPAPAQQTRIAPTAYHYGKLRVGIVHDPTASRMGRVAGHAGLFSTADDLALFARMLLDGGSTTGVRILNPLMVEQMTTPQSPPHKPRLRGLGWDIDAPFAANRSALPPVGAYGHTGFTGTSLWIDPVSQTYVILLTNRVYPDGKGDARPLRTHLAKVVAASLGPLSVAQVLASRPALSDDHARVKGPNKGVANGKVESGIDVLATEQFAPLAGLRIGLITNHTGLDSAGRRTLDLLYNTPGVKLAAIFSPEHGLYGTVDEKVASGMEASHYPARLQLIWKRQAADRGDARGVWMRWSLTSRMPGCTFIPISSPWPTRWRLRQKKASPFMCWTGRIRSAAPWSRTPSWTQTSPRLGVAMVEGANVSVGRGTATPFELLGAPWIEGTALAAYLNQVTHDVHRTLRATDDFLGHAAHEQVR